MIEEWRDIPGFEGKYQVSISTTEGMCRRVLKNGNTRMIKNNLNNGNRVSWVLRKNKTPVSKQAAVWIAMTYPELVQNEWFEGAEIDHIDTDRLNNHPYNLRWVTRKENLNNPLTIMHMSEAKMGKKATEETKKKMSEKRGKWVIKLSINNEILHFYRSTVQAERETGVCQQNIGACCRGVIKTAGGYIWKYAV